MGASIYPVFEQSRLPRPSFGLYVRHARLTQDDAGDVLARLRARKRCPDFSDADALANFLRRNRWPNCAADLWQRFEAWADVVHV